MLDYRPRFLAHAGQRYVTTDLCPTEISVSAPVRTTFTYTRDEYVLAMKRHYRSNLKVGRDVIGGLVAIMGGAYMVATTDSGWFGWLLLVAGTSLLAMVGYAIFLLPIMIYNSQPKLKDEYALIFSENDIGFKTNKIDAVLQWSFYHSWLSDDDFYILYHGKRDLSVIPRRVLSGGDDEGLRGLLSRKIGHPIV